MYVGKLSNSTVGMLNGFMYQEKEKYMIISDKFCIKGYGRKFYISFVLGRMWACDNGVYSNVLMTDLKKTLRYVIDIECIEEQLKNGDLGLCNITLPIYSLLKKCFSIISVEKDITYEKLIRFENPIYINAQCDIYVGQSYGDTVCFPLMGFVVFKGDASRILKKYRIQDNYDYSKIKV